MRLTRKQSLVISGGVVAIFFIATILWHKFKQQSVLTVVSSPTVVTSNFKKKRKKDDPPAIELVMGKFHRYETKDGHKLWEIKSEEGRYDPKEQRANLKDPKVWYYKKNGDVITLTAKRADVTIKDAKLDDIKLAGDIVITLNDLTLTTRRASMKEHNLLAPGHIKIEKKGFYLEGSQLKANLEKKEFVFEQDVETMFDQKLHKLSEEVPKETKQQAVKVKKRKRRRKNK